MAILKLFRNSNILENNMGPDRRFGRRVTGRGRNLHHSGLLIIMGYWEEFNYWETTLIAMTGGILGILFTIPLRNALIVQ